ncbi:uncharacterized protein BJ171DRAFT_495578 [Polychytrium aggregatum]|uniref:uncharacterized protein n=1 Tax=Polychytrium aggregatum TaxID=110093 RepID=UPI0022FE7B66|nr:uncharacterized protein BJ171DRAFT_495578 [Polychytrium aggregatum]KAI9207073.1 hypothetical protein BJ171DRAFT_495578 [Polychytrium aggregatum]
MKIEDTSAPMNPFGIISSFDHGVSDLNSKDGLIEAVAQVFKHCLLASQAQDRLSIEQLISIYPGPVLNRPLGDILKDARVDSGKLWIRYDDDSAHVPSEAATRSTPKSARSQDLRKSGPKPGAPLSRSKNSQPATGSSATAEESSASRKRKSEMPDAPAGPGIVAKKRAMESHDQFTAETVSRMKPTALPVPTSPVQQQQQQRKQPVVPETPKINYERLMLPQTPLARAPADAGGRRFTMRDDETGEDVMLEIPEAKRKLVEDKLAELQALLNQFRV